MHHTVNPAALPSHVVTLQTPPNTCIVLQGIHVKKFAIGFGPPLVKFEVRCYLLSCLPAAACVWVWSSVVWGTRGSGRCIGKSCAQGAWGALCFLALPAPAIPTKQRHGAVPFWFLLFWAGGSGMCMTNCLPCLRFPSFSGDSSFTTAHLYQSPM